MNYLDFSKTYVLLGGATIVSVIELIALMLSCEVFCMSAVLPLRLLNADISQLHTEDCKQKVLLLVSYLIWLLDEICYINVVQGIPGDHCSLKVTKGDSFRQDRMVIQTCFQWLV
ncbi:hypothetical protein ACOSQ2_025187 [Xanthoceras sorbifolium]